MAALLLLQHAIAQSPSALWAPSSVQDLHREYSNIFRHGNRNAASHLWSSFLFERAEHLSPETFETMCSGYCAVSGSPTRPSDYTRYRLTLPLVGGGLASGFMYYCCWPCVCDTQDFIRVDTRNVTLAGGVVRQYHWAVVGNPCEDEPALHRPFVQPFYGRGETTLAREAPEVRCDAEGRLIGATLSDHGYPIISMFFDAEVVDERTSAADADASTAVTPSSAAAGPPRPGRISHHATSGVAFQDEYEYSQMCAERAANGYNSGMGEIFRKVAGIAPVILRSAAERLPSPTPTSAADETAAAEATRPEQHEQPPQPPEPLLEEAPSRLLDEYEAAAANGHDERLASVTVDARRPASSPNPGRPQ